MNEKYSFLIKQKAKKFGFLSCGISKSGFLEDEAPRLEQWLKNNFHANMGYMENHFDKRLNTKLLVEGSKSVVSLLYNYYPEKQQKNDTLKIAKYAYGNDYHEVIKDKLIKFIDELKLEIGDFHARIFVDSAPVLERAWAKKSGLGWVGKNTNLITKKVGSFYFLAEIILDLALVYDSPTTDHCGSCTACIDACPTQALTPYSLDSNKCISYQTIENKNQIPNELKGKFENWIFGCDICQEVCPWNKFSAPTNEPLFKINPTIEFLSKKDWNNLNEEMFKETFKKSPIKRTKFAGLKRNIGFVLNKLG